jgi:predicted dehydrogenase
MEKIKVGIVGLRRGITHLNNFLTVDNAEVIGACDWYEINRNRGAERLAEAGSDAVIVEQFEDLLELEPDAIMLACNGRQQANLAVKAMEAGCHVLSEVPGAFTVEECIHVRDAVQRTGMTYMMGENANFWHFFRHWRKWMLEDQFGPISLAEAEYLHYLPGSLQAPDSSRYSPSQAREEGRKDCVPIWRADQPPIQYLTHDLGPLLEVLDDRCVSVTCMEGPWRCQEAPLRSDGQFALFQTAKGTLIRILVTLNTRRPSEHRYRLFGIQGACEFFSYEGFSRYFDRTHEDHARWDRVNIGLGSSGSDTSGGHGGADIQVAWHFADTVLNGKESPIDVYRMIEYTLPGILAAQSAELGGHPIQIPDLRPEPYGGTIFWDAVGLPDEEPEHVPYQV